MCCLIRYPSQPLQVPPGQYHQSPTEQYWNALRIDPSSIMQMNNNQVNNLNFSLLNENPNLIDGNGILLTSNILLNDPTVSHRSSLGCCIRK
jgi:hypothetical protein